MGLSKPAIRFLVRQHRHRPLGSRILTLGRQCVYADYSEVLTLLREEGVEPAVVLAGDEARSNIPQWRGTSSERRISDVGLFRLLGAKEVLALDYSDFEGAEIIADLNQPIIAPDREPVDAVIDSGTLEHVFDVRTALANIVALLKTGGRALHLSPTNNFVNHGFYQFSPTLFVDFYRANGFSELAVYLAEETIREGISARLDLYRIDADHQPSWITSSKRLLTLVTATKTTDSTADRIPLQSFYQRLLPTTNAIEIAADEALRTKSEIRESRQRSNAACPRLSKRNFANCCGACPSKNRGDCAAPTV
jgi:SAM-dependent methyltransferase